MFSLGLVDDSESYRIDLFVVMLSCSIKKVNFWLMVGTHALMTKKAMHTCWYAVVESKIPSP